MEMIATVLCCHKQKYIFFYCESFCLRAHADYWLSYVRQTRSNVCLQVGLWLPLPARVAKHSAHLTPTTTDVLAVCVMELVQSSVDTKHLCVLLKGLKQPSPVSFGSSDITSWYCNPMMIPMIHNVYPEWWESAVVMELIRKVELGSFLKHTAKVLTGVLSAWHCRLESLNPIYNTILPSSGRHGKQHRILGDCYWVSLFKGLTDLFGTHHCLHHV